MTVPIPDSLQQIDAAWLSDLLTHQGRFGTVEVVEATLTPAEIWNVAETGFIALRYADADTKLARHVFIKLWRDPDPLGHLFAPEPAFYRETAGQDLPIAPCLAACCDPASGARFVLLEDMRATHEATPWPLPPTLERCHLAVQALARLHATGAGAQTTGLAEREAQLAAIVDDMLPAFLAELGDRLPPARADLLSRVTDAIPELKAAHYRSGKPVTCIHGDAHVWNVLYPKDNTQGAAILIDFEDWRVDFAGLDLALMMALHWYPYRRAAHERTLLRSYRQAFNAHAAEPMAWEAIWDEYRLGHVCNAIIPIFQHAAGHAHASWWSNLERWFLAYDDLGCGELLA